MARQNDLPSVLAAVHPRFATPHRAEIAVALVVVALVLTTDLRTAIGFSSVGVLIYYAVANASAWTLPGGRHPFRHAIPLVGLVGCCVLVASLPRQAVLGGLAVLAIGILIRLVRDGRGFGFLRR